jgi:hypothetical protein
MASNDNNDKCKLEEDVMSSVVRKRLQLSDDDGGDHDFSDSPEEEMEDEGEEEETEEEFSSEESTINQLDTSEEKLLAKRGRDLFFDDDENTNSPS